MQPSKPAYTGAELLARHQHTRRWIVRITLGLLLVFVLLGMVGMALSSSGMSIEEAKVAYERFRSEKATVSMAESVIGKPLIRLKQNGEEAAWWVFTNSSWDKLDVFEVVCRESTSTGESVWINTGASRSYTGWTAWKLRWRILKFRLGFDPD